MRSNRGRMLVPVLAVALLSGWMSVGLATAADRIVTVAGEVPKIVAFDTEALAAMPRHTVEVAEQDGTRTTYEGVSLGDILARAGVPMGHELRGPRLAQFVVVEAYDDYRAVFALPELDPVFTDRRVILADRMNGKLLSGGEAPFRVVIPDEKRHARWVRQVKTLRVMSAPKVSESPGGNP